MSTQFMEIGNRFVTATLMSPFHRLLSRSLLLLMVRGRQSQRIYSTPVGYYQEGGHLLVFSQRSRRWWRNLQGSTPDGTPLELLYRGAFLNASACVSTDERDIAAALVKYRHVSATKAAQLAPACVLIDIQLPR